MTDTFRDLLVNLMAAGVAFCIGLFWRHISLAFRTRRLRAFWKPIASGGFRIAVGSGDIEAFARLREQLDRAGIRDFDLSPGQNVSVQQRGENLVLIGGPQSNQVAEVILEQVPATFGFGVVTTETGTAAAVYDHHLQTAISCRRGPSGEPESDHGIIIRCANPFNPEKSVVLLAGCLGFATTAATRLIESQDFLRNPTISSDKPFEAIFSCRVSYEGVTEVLLGPVRPLAPFRAPAADNRAVAD